jgi:hypothetical protein
VQGMGSDRSPAVRHARAWSGASGGVHDPLITGGTHGRHLGPEVCVAVPEMVSRSTASQADPYCYRLQRLVFQTCDSKPNLLQLQPACRNPNSVFSSNQLKNLWILSR